MDAIRTLVPRLLVIIGLVVGGIGCSDDESTAPGGDVGGGDVVAPHDGGTSDGVVPLDSETPLDAMDDGEAPAVDGGGFDTEPPPVDTLVDTAPPPDDTEPGPDTADDTTGQDTSTASELVVAPITSPQRGPVAITVSLADGGTMTGTLHVLFSTDGATFQEVSLFPWETTTVSGVSATVHWDSLADVSTDETITLKAVLDDDGVTIEGTCAPFELLDDPERPRVVAVTHAITTGTEDIHTVRLLTATLDGTLLPAVDPFDTPDDPTRVVFHPSGLMAFVLAYDDGTDVLVRLDLAADGGLTTTETIPLPVTNVMDVDIAPDGATVYLVSQGTNPDTRGVYAFALSPEGALGDELFRADLNNPRALGIVPTDGSLFVEAGVMMGDDPFEVLLSHEGAVLATSDVELGSSLEGPLVTPDGAHVLLLDDSMFDPRISLLSLADDAFSVVETITPLYGAYDVVEHEGTVLVSRLDEDLVSVYTLTPDGLVFQDDLEGLPLASSMDLVTTGSLAGTTYVGCVTEVMIVAIEADGTASVTGAGLDLGDGAPAIVEAIAVQP